VVEDPVTEELVNFFKALADANRLKIVGVLARGPQSVEQIAEILALHPSTISHHLSRLAKAGLVSARAEGYYSIYQLETKELENMARRLLEQETLPSVTADVDMGAYDRKVLKTFMTPEGRLKAFPAQQKKMEVILRFIIQSFEPGVRYTEKQVNEILNGFNEDYARLRRGLIDGKLLARDPSGSAYWRS
jgi:predicted transcriptional regulator